MLPRRPTLRPPPPVDPVDAGIPALGALSQPPPASDRPSSARPAALSGEPPEPERYRGQIDPNRLDPDAVKVLRRLAREGHTAYLVGGGVRDLLLDRSPKDFDIATSARPNEVRRLFRNCRVIGRRFRLAHILFSAGKIVEVATFRRDPSVREDEASFTEGPDGDSRSIAPPPKERGDDVDLLIRQDNVFGEPHEDAIRRDFTINGLFYDLEAGEVIDYVGGVRDLRANVMRTIGDPDVRFREDPVRILRAVKFSARLDFGISPDVYDAMVDQRDGLRRSAAPRVLEEILRLLRGGAAHRSIYLAWDVGALGVVLPELTAYLEDEAEGADGLWSRLAAVDEMQRAGRLPSDDVLLTALLYGPLSEALAATHDPATLFEEFFEELVIRLALPRRTRELMRVMLAAQRRLEKGRLDNLKSRDFFRDAALLFELRLRSEGREIPAWLREPLPEPPPRVRTSRRRRGGRGRGR